MGVELAIGGLIAGGVGASRAREGAEKAASAAQSAQLAKQAEARRQYDLGTGQVEKATVAGLLDYDKAIANQERNLARQEKLIAQIDPTIIEASQQALRLLRGDSASTLAPLKQQRDMQRQKLVDSLRAQMGPGAETSSAGIQALTRFDAETSSLMAGAQQQALGQLGQTFGQFRAGSPDMLREAQGLASLGQQKAGLGFQQAEFGRLMGQGLLGTAGAEHTYETMKGQADQAFGGQIAGLGGQMLGYGLSSAGKSFTLPEINWGSFGNIFKSAPKDIVSTQNTYGPYKSNYDIESMA